MLFTNSVNAQDNTITTFQENDVVSNSIIVSFKENITDSNQDKIEELKKLGGVRIQSTYTKVSIEVWKTSQNYDILLERLNKIDGVSACPDFIFYKEENEISFDTPNNANQFLTNARISSEAAPTDDPYLSQVWAYDNTGDYTWDDKAKVADAVAGADISLFDAWKIQTGSDDVAIVIFDTGVDMEHEDIQANAWSNLGEDINNDGILDDSDINGIDDDANGYADDFHGWSPIKNDNSWVHSHRHGTHVAGIAGAVGNNGIGISGVAQKVKIISVMIFNESGSTSISAILNGYAYISALLDKGVNIAVVNQSWGGSIPYSSLYLNYVVEPMRAWAKDHAEHNTIWTVSAGNSKIDRDNNVLVYSIPVNIQEPNVITVANTSWDETLSSSSCYGTANVDIGAPGSRIYSTKNNQDAGSNIYKNESGTSQAAPMVTGAIVLSRAQFPDEDYKATISRILATADEFEAYSDYYGEGGRLNVHAMLDPKGAGFNQNLIPSHDTEYFHYNAFEDDANQVVGFINNSASSLTINSISITGEAKESFQLGSVTLPLTVSASESFGIDINFTDKLNKVSQSAVLTIGTSAGNVVINLVGEVEENFALSFSASKMHNQAYTESTKYQIEGAIEASNLGRGDFDYTLTDDVLIKKQYDITNQVNQYINGATVESLPDTQPIVLEDIFTDDFNGSLNQWTVVSTINEPAKTWEILDLGATDNNKVLRFGDTQNETYTGSITATATTSSIALPVVDDKRLYLIFDYMASFENGDDTFTVTVTSEGSETLITTTENKLKSMAEAYQVMVDISVFAGKNITVELKANTIGSNRTGMGIVVDNLRISKGSFMEIPNKTSTVKDLTKGKVNFYFDTNGFPTGDYMWLGTFTANAAHSQYSVYSYQVEFTVEEREVMYVDSDWIITENTIIDKDLSIASGVTVTVKDHSSLDIKGNITNDGEIFIESGSSLITYEDYGWSGTATIHRKTRYANGQYSYVGTPVQQSSSIKGNLLGKTVYQYDETKPYGDNEGLSRWIKATKEELIPGRGYAQAYKQDIYFSGIPNNGTITYEGTYTETGDGSYGWNLVANPYPCAISVDKLLTANSNIDGAVYIWDDNGSHVERGTNADYIIVNKLGVSSDSRKGKGGRFNMHLGVSQGFFVKITDDESDRNISFTEDLRVKGMSADDSFFRKASDEPQTLTVSLKNNASEIYSETLLGFAEDATNGVDRLFDALKLSNNTTQLYSILNEKRYAIQGFPLIEMTGENIIPLGIDIEEAGDYTINISDIKSLPQNATISLIDTKYNTVHILSADSVYSFHTEAGADDSRFLLHVKDIEKVLANNLTEVMNYRIHSSGISLFGQLKKYNIEIMDITGKSLFNQSILNNTQVNYPFLKNQLYFVHINNSVHKIVFH